MDVTGTHLYGVHLIDGGQQFLKVNPVVGQLGYITDAQVVPDAAIQAFRGVKVLVLNALFRTEHPTHLSLPEAVRAARAIGAERTYLTHLTHDNLHADLEAELPQGITPAFDGLTVRVD